MKAALLILVATCLMSLPACNNTPDFFKAHKQEYLNISNLTGSTYEPCIIGKIIAIDTEDESLDDVYSQLPADLKPASHEEVGTVVWLNWGQVLVGTYTDGTKGYAHTCDVTIIDFANHVIITEKRFRGTNPPSSKSGGGSRYGSKPTKDILDYIRGLPRISSPESTRTQITTSLTNTMPATTAQTTTAHPVVTTAATISAITTQSEKQVRFYDANLEAAIRQTINKPVDGLTVDDLESITALIADERGINDLTGLEYCTNLTQLSLFNNNIRDISPLAALSQLQVLYLYQNPIEDCWPLSSLFNLRELKVGQTGITDITFLIGLTELETLYLPGNEITEIWPLFDLTKLHLLVLVDNNISDISPLLENTGLSMGDIIDLSGNPLNSESELVYLPQLISRGIDIRYE